MKHLFKQAALISGLALMGLLTTQCRHIPLSTRMAESEMTRFPQLYQFDHGKRLYFGYTQGVGGVTFMKLWKATGDMRYFDYVYQWGDSIIADDGSIHLYKRSDYNLDFINAGKVLIYLSDATGDPRFRMAMDTLLKQFDAHPRTSDGGFWHKKIYPHQMWLDGLYMASPFLCEYGVRYNRPDLVDEAIHQLVTVAKHTYDAEKGLFYHAWDESRTQLWADSLTGHSPHFWGRSIGWYAMALVDNLDYIPVDHPRRGEVLALVNTLAEGMAAYQDPASGLWYQVVDQGDREGNYLEASVSSMMMYFYAKSVNKGYLPKKWRAKALDAYNGLLKNLLIVDENGQYTLTHCCAVAGLGGKPYRDGSFEYYVNERQRDNDGKATGPFIMGCLELNR
jgi:unsaturated rhamnogalacturonyl hydrolase